MIKKTIASKDVAAWPSGPQLVTATSWRDDTQADADAVAAALPAAGGVVIAACRPCPGTPPTVKNAMVGAALAPYVPTPKWMTVIEFQTAADAAAWGTNNDFRFDVIQSVPKPVV